jgi:thiamine biosynthesis lipoprotein
VIIHHRIALSGKATKVLIAGLVVCSVIGFFVISRGKAEPKLFRQSQFLLDTFVEMTVAAVNEQDARDAMADAYAEMRRVEALLSKYRSDSQIAKINQFVGDDQFVPVDPEVRDILQRSLQYSVMTGGLFDITIGSLIDLWGIGTEHERIPDDSELKHILPFIDYRNVEIQADQGVRLRYQEVKLDLGGIAKGYSVDRGIEVLQSRNISSALLNAGGDIRCIGMKPDGTPWRIGVQHPRESGILGVIELQDASVATSGDYERYFMHQGIRYHHIFLPSTGMPGRECQSVTILANATEVADVLATAVFVMGPVQGLAFIEDQPDVEGMIVRADGEIISSSGFSFKPR